MNTPHDMDSHVVVAGLASLAGRQVARWAAVEASARHAELRLVSAHALPAALDRYVPNATAEEHLDEATRLLTRVAGEIGTDWPDLAVTTALVPGPPAAALRIAAVGADLLVVGADDASPFAEAISGSVPGELLTTTPCPLVVVPRQERTAPAAAPVVVAFDESPASQSALAYAFAAASRSHRPLTVVRCVPSRGTTPSDVARALIGFGELYASVPVATEVIQAEPKDALVTMSRRAALLVLGSRGRGRLASGLFGSVSRHLIRRSACPVVVAHSHMSANNHIALSS
jgi:nucleotide-binding universal stress UspA family protein